MMAKAERTERLTREIQSAKMELAQIRARHPEPRLTLDEASQFCDDQMERFIALSETKDELAGQSVAARERADKEETKMRSLREELMKREREVEKAKAKQMTGEAPMLPDRCVLVSTFSIGMHTFRAIVVVMLSPYHVLTSFRPAG
jgi:chromosome segregation ATPase